MKSWLGGNDHKTSPSCFWSSHEYHWDAFKKVRDFLIQLSLDRTTGYPLVELIYLDDEGVHPVIAYRYTSDAAFDSFERRVMEIGGGDLGRGTWEPWSGDASGKYWFKFYFTENEVKHSLPGVLTADEYYNLIRKLKGAKHGNPNA